MADVSVFSVVHVMVAKVEGRTCIIDVDNVSPLLLETRYNLEKTLSIQKGLVALLHILQEYLNKGIELERICRVAVLLCQSGVSTNNSIFKKIARRCLAKQKNDGGWIGVEDSIWCVAFLREFEGYEYNSAFESGLNWLEEQKLKGGGWGKTKRDTGRIPITGTLLYLLPELSNVDSCRWLEHEWSKEFGLHPTLTYKSAFTLMALKKSNHQFADTDLLDNSLNWLISQQNEDHGFGHWKGHPMGSDPWCTGVSVIGLLQYPKKVPERVIQNSLKWLKEKQLPNGFWAYHYVEEGSIWALYALTKGYSYLRGES